MRKFTLVVVWALAVLSSLAIQRFAMTKLVDGWSVVLAAVVAGLTLAAMEWLRRCFEQERRERARILHEVRAVRAEQENAARAVRAISTVLEQ